MKLKSAIIFALFILAGISSSCKKDPIDNTKTPEELLVGNYMLTALSTDYGLGTPFDALAFIEECFRDNILMFFADHTFIMDEGEIKCNPDHSQIYEQGNWQLLENATILKYGSFEIKVVELTNAHIISTYEHTFPDGKSYTFKQTFTRI